MGLWLVVIVVVLGIALLAFTTWAMAVGAIGVLTGERVERCPHCHHRVLTVHGEVHAAGCPHAALHLPHSHPHPHPHAHPHPHPHRGGLRANGHLHLGPVFLHFPAVARRLASVDHRRTPQPMDEGQLGTATEPPASVGSRLGEEPG